MKQTRQKILSEAEIVSKKPRFGLFSQPPPIALCDNSYFHSKSANKGEDGKPKTKPRNMLAGTNRTGRGKKAFIQYPDSIYQKDPYKDPFKIELQYERKFHGRSTLHQNAFRSTSFSKTVTNTSYLYIEEQENKEKKQIKRDQNGRVKTEPSNVLTNPISKIQDKLFHHVKHMKDEYDRPKEIQRQNRQLSKTKMKGEIMFRSTSHGGNYFSKERLQFGLDDKSTKALEHRKTFKFGPYSRVKHEVRFKLARRGHGDPIGRYPQYVEPRLRLKTEALERQKTDQSDSERGDWRPSSGLISRPTPSICLMMKNIRKNL